MAASTPNTTTAILDQRDASSREKIHAVIPHSCGLSYFKHGHNVLLPDPSASSRYARREHSGSFNLRFERFERGPDDFSSQTCIQFFGQARIAARMGNTYAFDDTIRAHLHRHWKHRAH